MKIILLFGAGKSATVLIKYLLKLAPEMNWKLIVVDTDLQLVSQKLGSNPLGIAQGLDVKNDTERSLAISKADLVISLLPPHLHILVAKDCLKHQKHLFTASYLDKEVEMLNTEIERKGLLFLYEMGLDPGIDHMSAMAILDRIRDEGGKITSFISHCGGLVSPQCDNNPWHYKISWNPANVVSAGKQGAIFKQDGAIVELTYAEVFNQVRKVSVKNAGLLAWYPNRNSIPYCSLYRLEDVSTFIRTTLRHPDFIKGWTKLISLGLTQDQPVHTYRTSYAPEIILSMLTASNQAVQYQKWLDEDPLFLNQIVSLGLGAGANLTRTNSYSPASFLQELLERNLGMSETDQDRVIMQHEILYSTEEKNCSLISSLVLDGDNAADTAMAKTVGLPLGIAAMLFFKNKLKVTGLQRPLSSVFYSQILPLLEKEKICFKETETCSSKH